MKQSHINDRVGMMYFPLRYEYQSFDINIISKFQNSNHYKVFKAIYKLLFTKM